MQEAGGTAATPGRRPPPLGAAPATRPREASSIALQQKQGVPCRARSCGTAPSSRVRTARCRGSPAWGRAAGDAGGGGVAGRGAGEGRRGDRKRQQATSARLDESACRNCCGKLLSLALATTPPFVALVEWLQVRWHSRPSGAAPASDSSARGTPSCPCCCRPCCRSRLPPLPTHLQPVCAEGGVFEKLPEALNVSLPPHVGQVGHHVGDDLAEGGGERGRATTHRIQGSRSHSLPAPCPVHPSCPAGATLLAPPPSSPPPPHPASHTP